MEYSWCYCMHVSPMYRNHESSDSVGLMIHGRLSGTWFTTMVALVELVHPTRQRKSGFLRTRFQKSRRPEVAPKSHSYFPYPGGVMLNKLGLPSSLFGCLV